MKLAAVRAIASLAEENVPDEVSEAYGEGTDFGRDLIIPKPVDPRLISPWRLPWRRHGLRHCPSPHHGLGPLQAPP